MATVDMKALLGKLNSFSSTTLHAAATLCVVRTQYEVTVEHFFLKALEDTRSDLYLILKQYEVDSSILAKTLGDSLEELKTGNAGRPVFSPLLVELFQDAWSVTSIDLGEEKIRTGAVLLAFLSKIHLFADRPYTDLLGVVGRETLVKNFTAFVRTSKEQTAPPPASRPAAGPTASRPAGLGGLTGAQAGANRNGPIGLGGENLKQYTVDYTQRAREGRIDPIFGRDKEVREIVDILARRRKNNPILVGDPGVGKTAVVEGLALRITEADVPEMLQGVTLIGLDMGALQAGASMKGEFENRLKGVINEIKASEKPIILFIDEAHTLVGGGGPAGGGDASNLLKPVLARGEVRTIAATTWSEYKKYFEKDPALARRFQLVRLGEPDVATTTLILRGLKSHYEAAHQVVIRDDAIVAAAELSDRYISGRYLPDKAIDLIDTASARVKVNLSAKPAALEDKERSLQALEREKKALERDRSHHQPVDEEQYQKVVDRIETITAEAQTVREQWLKELEAARQVLELRKKLAETEEAEPDLGRERAAELKLAQDALETLKGKEGYIHVEVSPDVVAAVVSDWTGIPVGKMLRDEADTIIHLEEKLAERIKGQGHALTAMAQVIRAGKSGLKNPASPLGVFLLVGPSGVGKTETGLALADLLFGGERNMVTINMSEFQESHTVSRLIGSPPGYVGFGEGGVLTEAVRQNPYSVVLLDEVEKAHLDVMNLFYQVFDKGMLADGEGKEINFKNTIMILTSNLGTDVIQAMTAENRPELEEVMTQVRPILSKHFKPALLARMSAVPYYSLGPDAMRRIVALKLERLQKTLMENNRIQLTWDDEVQERITARCTEVETGARNIEYILSGKVLPRLSQTILARMAEGAMPSRVHLKCEEDGSFSMDLFD